MQPITPMTRSGRAFLRRLQRAELREDLVLGLFADGAGIEQDHVGVLGLVAELVLVGS